LLSESCFGRNKIHRGRSDKTGNKPQYGRLAATRRADQHNELLVSDFQIDAMDDFRLAEALDNISKYDTCHGPILWLTIDEITAI